MTDLNKIVEDLSKLTVVEAAELSKTLEEKWGVTAAAPVAVAAVGAAGGEAAEEKTDYHFCEGIGLPMLDHSRYNFISCSVRSKLHAQN